MFCKNCGYEVSASDKFCKNCGTAIHDGANKKNVEEKTVNINGVEMTAEDLYNACAEKKYLFYNDDNFVKEQIYKVNRKEFVHYFRSAIGAVQSDESVLSYFAGIPVHKHILINRGWHVFLLTDKRMISAGYSRSYAGMFNPIKTYVSLYKVLASVGEMDVESVYLRDIINVQPNMVEGRGVISFNMSGKSYDVMVYDRSLTHQLCTEISETISQIKEG